MRLRPDRRTRDPCERAGAAAPLRPPHDDAARAASRQRSSCFSSPRPCSSRGSTTSATRRSSRRARAASSCSTSRRASSRAASRRPCASSSRRTSAPASSSSRTRPTSCFRPARPDASSSRSCASSARRRPASCRRTRGIASVRERGSPKGLKVAREALLREGRRGGTIILLVDLEVLPDEIQRLVAVFADLRRDGFEVRIVPLGPRDGAARLMELLLGGEALLPEPVERRAGRAGAAARKPHDRPAVGCFCSSGLLLVAGARDERAGARAARGEPVTRRDEAPRSPRSSRCPVALVLVVLAVDVLRTPGWISADDSRFQSAPLRGSGLWNEPGLLATRARLRDARHRGRPRVPPDGRALRAAPAGEGRPGDRSRSRRAAGRSSSST